MSLKIKASFVALLFADSTDPAMALTIIVQPAQEVVIREYVSEEGAARLDQRAEH